MLQSVGHALGVSIDRTPKCHCELAGKGIRYSWGCAKNAYWLLPLSEKRKKEAFWESVRKFRSHNVLSMEWIWKSSRRACKYVCAYHILHEGMSLATTWGTASTTEDSATPVWIEKLVKKCKIHRCALDFDKGFIKADIIVIDYYWVGNGVDSIIIIMPPVMIGFLRDGPFCTYVKDTSG